LQRLFAPFSGARLRYVVNSKGVLEHIELIDNHQQLAAEIILEKGENLRVLLWSTAHAANTPGSRAALNFNLQWQGKGLKRYLRWDRAAFLQSQQEFYAQLLFGKSVAKGSATTKKAA